MVDVVDKHSSPKPDTPNTITESSLLSNNREMIAELSLKSDNPEKSSKSDSREMLNIMAKTGAVPKRKPQKPTSKPKHSEDSSDSDTCIVVSCQVCGRKSCSDCDSEGAVCYTTSSSSNESHHYVHYTRISGEEDGEYEEDSSDASLEAAYGSDTDHTSLESFEGDLNGSRDTIISV